MLMKCGVEPRDTLPASGRPPPNFLRTPLGWVVNFDAAWGRSACEGRALCFMEANLNISKNKKEMKLCSRFAHPIRRKAFRSRATSKNMQIGRKYNLYFKILICALIRRRANTHTVWRSLAVKNINIWIKCLANFIMTVMKLCAVVIIWPSHHPTKKKPLQNWQSNPFGIKIQIEFSTNYRTRALNGATFAKWFNHILWKVGQSHRWDRSHLMAGGIIR